MNLDEIEAKAKACQECEAPGPWESIAIRHMQHEVHGPGRGDNNEIACCGSKIDADFIAACDPQTVLALVRVARAAQEISARRRFAPFSTPTAPEDRAWALSKALPELDAAVDALDALTRSATGAQR